MIQFKTNFHGWQEVSEKQARKLALQIYYHATAMSKDQKIAHINSRLHGTTFNELFCVTQ